MSRTELLEDLFHACDDDGSLALSLAEFAQLFESCSVDATTRQLFNDVDMHGVTDGVLTLQEFVDFHLTKFSALDDETFEAVCTSLTERAEERFTIDEEPAVANEEPPAIVLQASGEFESIREEPQQDEQLGTTNSVPPSAAFPGSREWAMALEARLAAAEAKTAAAEKRAAEAEKVALEAQRAAAELRRAATAVNQLGERADKHAATEETAHAEDPANFSMLAPSEPAAVPTSQQLVVRDTGARPRATTAERRLVATTTTTTGTIPRYLQPSRRQRLIAQEREAKLKPPPPREKFVPVKLKSMYVSNSDIDYLLNF